MFFFLTTCVYSQTSPIQSGSTASTDNFYHLGNIGIGHSATPAASLHIIEKDYGKTNPVLLKLEGTVPYVSDPGFYFTPILEVKDDGKIGIGTYSPLDKFHIQNGRLRIQSSSSYLVMGANPSNNTLDFNSNTGAFAFNQRIIIQNSSGIGQGSIQIALNSDGTIRAREVKVDLETIPDYVFKDDYELMSLEDLKKYIEKHHHLPNIKSAEEFNEEGSYSLGEMNRKLLEKVEELTLYVLAQQEAIEKLQEEVNDKK